MATGLTVSNVDKVHKVKSRRVSSQ